MKNKDEIIESISDAIAGILAVATNEWTSVKTFSLTKILKKNDVNLKYLPYITHELKVIGLLFIEGERSGMRYKIDSAVTYDAMGVAKKIYESHAQNARVSQGYPEANVGDLTPKQNNKRYGVNDLEKTSKVESHMRRICLPNIGDKRFMLRDNEIVEVKVRGVRLANDEDASSMKLYIVRWYAAGDLFYTEEVYAAELFETVEDLLKSLSKKHRKYTEFVKDKSTEKQYISAKPGNCVIIINKKKYSVNCDFLESVLSFSQEEREELILGDKDTFQIY